MERECEECSSWEQTIYWNHFQSIHFSQILPSDFQSQLMIPQKFTDYARGKLQDKVTLKGPNGTTTWEVGFATNGDKLFLRDGWTEFVNAFSLQQNDIVIFKYNGNSCFSTLIFDRGSMCEKESSYFTKKCGHSQSRHDNMNQEKRASQREVSEEFPQDCSHEELELNPSKKPRKDENGWQNPNSSEHITASDVPEDPEMRDMKAVSVDVEEAVEFEQRPENQQKSWSWEPVKLPCAVIEEQIKAPMEVPSTNIVAANASKGTVSKHQREATLRMAKKQLTSDSFLAVMRPTSVHRVFYLNVPAAWISQNLSFETQTVRLRTNEKTWPTKLQCRSNGLRGGLTVGWKAFALDNCLKESDVCVFKLANTPKHEPIILDVTIFRVPIVMTVPPSSTS